MECNKDEASRAKEIAERKLSANDNAGAKKFALKAHSLYPNLEGLSQMLAVIEVNVAAETRIRGELDWYGILGVDPNSDDDTVRKHYRKLALMLHPDKNKSIGAEGAFKLISEAWSLLCDKSKRVAYNSRRFSRPTQQNAQPASRGPSAPPGPNGCYNFSNSANSNVRPPCAPPGSNSSVNFSNNSNSNLRPPKTSTKRSSPKSAPAHSKLSRNTFWTACNNCKMQYEYARIYLSKQLKCVACHLPFKAMEVADPQRNGSNASKSGSSQQTTFQRAPNFRVDGTRSATASPSSTARVPDAVQQTKEKVAQEHELAQADVRRQAAALPRKHNASKRVSSATEASTANLNPELKQNIPVKRRRVDDSGVKVYRGKVAAQMVMGNGTLGSNRGGVETERNAAFSGGGNYNSTRDLSQLEIQNMLVKKARKEIHKKLQELSMTASANATKKETMDKLNRKDEETIAVKGQTYIQNKLNHMDTKKEIMEKDSHEVNVGDPDAEACEPTLMNVPDPDFHDFDMDRSERSFEDNQVWAAYDNDDGMPRYYAMIHSVISLNPFKVRVGWLNSKTNSELGPLTWIGSGFSKLCGEFMVGKDDINKSLNSFSHKVRWTKGTKGSIQIYPKKGDVWALYSNWSPDWNEHTPDEVIHKYDMVGVIDDYNKEQGVSVSPLIKVAGFKTVFHLSLDPQKVKSIPREEMFRFSHQVPSCVLTGQEANNAPPGCIELDPAATPMELHQVIAEAKKEDHMEANKGKNVINKH